MNMNLQRVTPKYDFYFVTALLQFLYLSTFFRGSEPMSVRSVTLLSRLWFPVSLKRTETSSAQSSSPASLALPAPPLRCSRATLSFTGAKAEISHRWLQLVSVKKLLYSYWLQHTSDGAVKLRWSKKRKKIHFINSVCGGGPWIIHLWWEQGDV